MEVNIKSATDYRQLQGFFDVKQLAARGADRNTNTAGVAWQPRNAMRVKCIGVSCFNKDGLFASAERL